MLQFNLKSSLQKALVCAGVASLTFGVNLASASNGFIIKFKEDSHNNGLFYSANFAKLKIQQITGDKSITLDPIANGAFNLSFKNKLIGSDQIIGLLKSDPSVKYIVPDRIGYFVPVPDPAPKLDLISNLDSTKSAFAKIAKNTNTDEKTLVIEHSLQWDEFHSPEGVFLESAPNMNDGAWRYSLGGMVDSTPVVAAVLDTGLEYNNNLAKNIVKWPESDNFFGWNFSENNDNLSDHTGGYHGTHVAGTIAAHGPSVLGMGTSLKVLPVKVCTDEGLFYESKVLKGIYWAIGEKVAGVPDNPYPAKVINMSFGIDEYVGKEVDSCSPAVQEAIDYARSKGVIMVVAAGNSNLENDLGSPGGCTGTIRVASTGPTGLRSYFSNFGEGVNFAAPGGDKKYGNVGGILSTVKQGEGFNDTDYDFYQGTSMAAPHVAGLAALIYSVNDFTKNYTGQDVEKLMHTTTHDFGTSVSDENSCKGVKSCGHGIINANNALEAALNNYDILFSAPTTDLLGLANDENCRGGLVKPAKTEIVRAEGTWHLVNESSICQYEVEFSHPTLSHDADNRIVTATYGHVKYKLEYPHNYCKQIGYDGMGCYK